MHYKMAFTYCYKSDKIMDKWTVEISQNGWEYTGWCTIKAEKVEKIGEDTILADGIRIQFDEEIREPYKQEDE